jgi:2-polyprenyl-3-methyl-5-hydroxy-6-metoxy-1,4-benzoquinol methylase
MTGLVDGGPCRFCGAQLTTTFVDLGMSPLCETFLLPEELNAMEPFFPLHTFVCGECYLVQLQEYVDVEEIFREYAYFSSYSDAWLQHAREYTESMISRLGLGADSLVVELASNDGYLLQWFKEKGVPVLGIEPARNVAQVAIDKGIPTNAEFFGTEYAKQLAAEGVAADLILGNNVLAQVPDLNDFVGGMPHLLKPTGTVTIEFPHLQRLYEGNQFDTIYHEHFSYFSLITAEKIFAAHDMTIYDVEELWTHGGSIRIIARPAADESRPVTDRLLELRQREIDLGYTDLATYTHFTEQVEATKRRILEFLVKANDEGKRVVGYGAPGKGNTLLNYCGIRSDLIEFTVDRNPYKHGRFLPGTHIPVLAPEALDEAKPDYIFILPWNLRDEISSQLEYAREWGAQFVVPIPELEVF